MRAIRTSEPINIIVHYPTTEEGWQELANRVTSVHADLVNRYIQRLDYPSPQKIALIDAIIETVSREIENAQPN